MSVLTTKEAAIINRHRFRGTAAGAVEVKSPLVAVVNRLVAEVETLRARVGALEKVREAAEAAASFTAPYSVRGAEVWSRLRAALKECQP